MTTKVVVDLKRLVRYLDKTHKYFDDFEQSLDPDSYEVVLNILDLLDIDCDTLFSVYEKGGF